MAYFRQTKNGKTLVMTAKDKAKNAARSYAKLGHYTVKRFNFSPVNVTRNLETIRRSTTMPFADLALWRDLMTNRANKQYKVLAATLRYKRLGIESTLMSLSGDPDYVRRMLNDTLEELRFVETLIRAYQNGDY